MPAGWVSAAAAVYSATQGGGGGGSSGGGGGGSSGSDLAAQVAQDQWNWYKTNYQPLESNLINQAQTAGSPEEFARARGAANADVTNSFDRAKKQGESRMQTMGLNPGSPAYQSGASSMDLAEGAARAGALTTADNNTRNLAYSKALDVVGLGKNIPAQSAASAANAQTAATVAQKQNFYQNQQDQLSAGRGIAAAGQLGQKAYDWFNKPSYSSNDYGGGSDWSSGGSSDFGNSMDSFGYKKGGKVNYAKGGLVMDAEQDSEGTYAVDDLKSRLMDRGIPEDHAEQASQSAKKGKHPVITPHMKHKPLGYASGGEIPGLKADEEMSNGDVSAQNQTLEGPGTETSDDIPAMIDGQQPAALSKNEFVMNAEVPKLTGEEILTAINDAGLKKRGQPGLEEEPVESMPQTAYRKGGKVKPHIRYAKGGKVNHGCMGL